MVHFVAAEPDDFILNIICFPRFWGKVSSNYVEGALTRLSWLKKNRIEELWNRQALSEKTA